MRHTYRPRKTFQFGTIKVIKTKKVVLTKEPEVKRKLSKKKRKQLERLLDQKDKKSKRGELLERLSKLQVPTSELEQYKSIAHLGTNHSHKSLAKLPDKQFSGKINTVKGSKRKSKNNQDEEKEEIEEESEEVSTDEEEDEEMKTEDKTEENTEENITEDNPKPSEDQVRKRAREDSDDEEEKLKKKPKLLGPKLKFVEVQRNEEIQNGRLELPILSEEGNILEAVNNNDVILICGETGSGKTTQVPQFLYEAG